MTIGFFFFVLAVLIIAFEAIDSIVKPLARARKAEAERDEFKSAFDAVREATSRVIDGYEAEVAALLARVEKEAAGGHADPNLPPGEYVVTVDTVGGAATVNAGSHDDATLATVRAHLLAAETERDQAIAMAEAAAEFAKADDAEIVAWRTRALRVEGERDAAIARAEKAEAERDGLRALLSDLDAFSEMSPGYLDSPCCIAVRAALAEQEAKS